MANSPRFVVVGTGITGLAAAHRLLELAREQRRAIELTVLEATNRHGGLFGSERIGDYLIELGADSFITNKPAAVNLCDRLGIELIPTDARFRRSLILLQGRPVPTPEGFNLLAPGKLWPLVTSPLLSWKGKLRVLAERFVAAAQASDQDESLAAFVRRRFGQEVLDRIVQPLVAGIYTSDLERLSLAATLPRFIEMERRHGSLIRALRAESRGKQNNESASGARYGLFATPRQGMQQLLDTLLNQVQATSKVRWETPVVAINPKAAAPDSHPNRTGWELRLASGELLGCDRLILAVASHQAAQLLQGSQPELARSLASIEYASSAIVVSGHRLQDIAHPCDAFGLVIPHLERRRILATSFLSRKFPGRAPEDRIILRTFVGGAMQPEELNYSDDELTRRVLSELREILGVQGTPDFVKIAHYRHSMPQLTLGHLSRIKEIRHWASACSGLALAGNYLEGVGVPDSIASGEAAADAVWQVPFPVTEKGGAVA